jgi:hypothetical protein
MTILVRRRKEALMETDMPRAKKNLLEVAKNKELELERERGHQQHQLSLDLAFLRFKLCIRASKFEKTEAVINGQRLAYNQQRYELERQFAPLPLKLQDATSKLEAVELELGSVTTDLEIINLDKLGLLISKVNMGKAIGAIQNLYGFTVEEGSDPRLVAIDKIAALESSISARQRELELLKGEIASEENVMLHGARAEAALREARELVHQEQEAKLWAYRNLESHRLEFETYKAISAAHNKSILKAAFIESKARVYEYWDDLLQAENDVLRGTLAANGLAVGPAGLALAPRGGGVGVGRGGGQCHAQSPRPLRPPRMATPEDFRVSDPHKGVEGAAAWGFAGSQVSGGAARKRGNGKHSEKSRLL